MNDNFNEHMGEPTSLTQLVRNILDDCKLDVDAIEECDPDFIEYISDRILQWHNENK